uniref:Acyl-CoA thioesterase 19 n=1 Tax=Oryzias melastigma TaxID=30732 RepID=A0A3B3CIG0_ORYME
MCPFVQQVRMDNSLQRVKLSVHPSRALVDEEFVILVQNVPPGSPMTLHALHCSEDGHRWEACGHYIADSSGSINAADDCSVGGSYLGVEPMGLLWSLKPVPGSKPGLRMRKKDVQTPMVVAISVFNGHHSEAFVDQVSLASWVVERWYMAPGVRRIPVTEQQLTGTLFLPPGPGPFPGLLDLWGGGGQLVEYRSALLASHGIASLALDYLTNEFTTQTGKMVDNQYFETAYRVLQQHPQVLGSRIAMLGLSLGSVFTLKMAVYSPVVKLRCAVCISGSHIQPVSGGPQEMMDLFTRNIEKINFSEQNEVIWRSLLLPVPSDPSMKADVGRLRCPLLLVVGEDDQNWCTQESAADMEQMMARAGNDHLLTILSYPETGHLIEPPYTPHTPSSMYRGAGVDQKMMVLWGGKTPEHSAAQEDSWRKILTFLKKNLYGGSDPQAIHRSHL